MLFMNDFVEREWNQMQNFLKQISVSSLTVSSQLFEYISSSLSVFRMLLD